jgi:HD-GYP domain-containing protein (c-di-GMP phosphodiesterase class II)
MSDHIGASPESPRASDRPMRVIVDGLVKMMYNRDPATGIHLDAVGRLARRLGTALGYDQPIRERVELAARLHDIGKHVLPLGLLLKPSALSSDEWDQMRLHADHGAALVNCFGPIEPLGEIVRLHHERIDGRGYPEGRQGVEIPVEARIIAIADAFHAMTVARPYTYARTPAAALDELLRCAGTQFEAEFVDAFVGMFSVRESRVSASLAESSAEPTLEETAG